MKKSERYKVVRLERVWDAPLTKKQAEDTAKKRRRDNPGHEFAVMKMKKDEPDWGFQ